MRVCNLMVTLVVALTLLNGCASKTADMKIIPSINYTLVQEQDGLRLAIDPFLDKKRLAEYFGDDFPQGILPVLIAANNSAPKSGFLIERKNIELVSNVYVSTKENAPVNPSVTSPTADALMDFSRGFGILLIPIVAFPVFITAESIQKDNKVKTVNLEKVSFTDRTLYAGEVHSGFVFFPVNEKELSPERTHIRIVAKNVLSDEELEFIIPFKK